MGAESLPRKPMPSNLPTTCRPAVSRGTSQIVLGPSAAIGLLDHTYAVAWLAEVHQLFFASRRMPSFSRVAVLTGAQKWLREPASENASVLRWRPAAMSLRIASGPCASITAVPQ